jgi:hypothetical protein
VYDHLEHSRIYRWFTQITYLIYSELNNWNR